MIEPMMDPADDIAVLKEEVDALTHDIDRHLQIATDLTNEVEQLRRILRSIALNVRDPVKLTRDQAIWKLQVIEGVTKGYRDDRP